jgi:hypothetical protein
MYTANLPVEPIIPVGELGWIRELMRDAKGRAVSATIGNVHVALRR